MKNQLVTLLFALAAFQPVFAQSLTKPTEDRMPKLIVCADVGFQWFNVITRFSSLKIEYPVTPYRQLGIRFSKILSGHDYYYGFGYSQSLKNGSFEVGIDSKYFPHGRFTGRKTGFYIGPDLRFGVRKFSTFVYDFQTGTNIQTDFKHLTSKLMLAWGVQWHFGQHIVFDLSAPIGIEYYQTKDPRNGNNNNTSSSRSLVMLPTIMMGFAF